MKKLALLLMVLMGSMSLIGCMSSLSSAANALTSDEGFGSDQQALNQFKQHSMARQQIPARTLLEQQLQQQFQSLLGGHGKGGKSGKVGTAAYYKTFVTPNDPVVKSLAQRYRTPQALFQLAESWPWVSDERLWRQPDKWSLPADFLSKSPTLATNPFRGQVADDCEEHAYTLVSLLRATGIPATDVRVAMGDVDFGDGTGGHALVQLLKPTGRWLNIEPSSGNYWDNQTNQVVRQDGIPYSYFKTHKYPVKQLWLYFNDTYFWDKQTHQGNAPTSWHPKGLKRRNRKGARRTKKTDNTEGTEEHRGSQSF